jgi:alkanesulfonate monooxygenase SsuD/methylene tetrahydromethanopterin reductase-like flavin-dependent oxidoreductase (luciferase family)
MIFGKNAMELGIYTFGDITPDPNTGRAIGVPQRYAEILAAAKLADDAGLDVFGIGEHHRLDLSISSPAVSWLRSRVEQKGSV